MTAYFLSNGIIIVSSKNLSVGMVIIFVYLIFPIGKRLRTEKNIWYLLL